ncbi:MAG: hypothetical protein AABX33_06425 [Nanoarchaeota archaeon]
MKLSRLLVAVIVLLYLISCNNQGNIPESTNQNNQIDNSPRNEIAYTGSDFFKDIEQTLKENDANIKPLRELLKKSENIKNMHYNVYTSLTSNEPQEYWVKDNKIKIKSSQLNLSSIDADTYDAVYIDFKAQTYIVSCESSRCNLSDKAYVNYPEHLIPNIPSLWTQLTGFETIIGEELVHSRLAVKFKGVYGTVWIDKENGLPLRVELKEEDDNQELPSIIFEFKDMETNIVKDEDVTPTGNIIDKRKSIVPYYKNNSIIIHINQNPSACKNITDSKERNICFMNAARDYLNVSICGYITDSNTKEWCKREIAISESNFSKCESLNQQEKSACYIGIGRSSKNVSVCKMINNELWSDQCIYSIATDSKDAVICGNIMNPTKVESCEISAVSNLKDIGYCDKMLDLNNKDACYSSIAIKVDNISVCNKIQGKMSMFVCYQSLNFDGLDNNICEQAPSDFIKNNCIKAVTDANS